MKPGKNKTIVWHGLKTVSMPGTAFAYPRRLIRQVGITPANYKKRDVVAGAWHFGAGICKGFGHAKINACIAGYRKKATEELNGFVFCISLCFYKGIFVPKSSKVKAPSESYGLRIQDLQKSSKFS